MLPVLFKGAEAKTGRKLLQHTPDEADRLADFINNLAKLRDPELIRQRVEKAGGVWQKPKIVLSDSHEDNYARYLDALGKLWFYDNIQVTIHIIPGCLPVLVAGTK